MENTTRFDAWSPLVPKIGEEVQVRFDTGAAFDTVVRNRMTHDGVTFVIVLDWPWSLIGILFLEITPNASGCGKAEHPEKRVPWWRIIPHPEHPAEETMNVRLFLK